MARAPDRLPLSSNGATRASAAMARRDNCPNSGNSAINVQARTGPTPGTVRRRRSVSHQYWMRGDQYRDRLVLMAQGRLEGLALCHDRLAHERIAQMLERIAAIRYPIAETAADS